MKELWPAAPIYLPEKSSKPAAQATAHSSLSARRLQWFLISGNLTKFRKTFTKGEMEDELLIVPAKLGQAEDQSEYEEILPTSPP